MIVYWMRVGFVHGVTNTDNMSFLGLTIDYRPYGWLEDFDPDWKPNTQTQQVVAAASATNPRSPCGTSSGWPRPSILSSP